MTQLQQKMLDAAVPASERLFVLRDFRQLAQSGRGEMSADALSHAIAMATGSADAKVRALLWQVVRGSRDAALVEPLIASAHRDPDGEVRLQAVHLMKLDFATDPRVRVALEGVRREDSSPIVRALAQRALMDDDAWMKFIVTSLEDRSQLPVERMAALLFQFKESPRGLPELFANEEAVQALAEAMPNAFPSTADGFLMPVILSRLGLNDHPAIIGSAAVTDMLLVLGSREDTTPYVMQYVVTGLVRHPDDPRVRAVLEKIVAGNGDASLREMAAKALGSPAPPAQ